MFKPILNLPQIGTHLKWDYFRNKTLIKIKLSVKKQLISKSINHC